MKLFEQPEPKLRSLLGKTVRSRKSEKRLRNKAIRRELNRNYNSGKELMNRCVGWEF